VVERRWERLTNEKARWRSRLAGPDRASPGRNGSHGAASRTGGEGGIRTLETLAGLTVFEIPLSANGLVFQHVSPSSL